MNKALINNMSQWLKSASEGDIVLLRGLSNTPRNLVYQWAKGLRNISPLKAGQVSEAMLTIKGMHPDAPAPLERGDLCTICSTCPHFLASKNSDNGTERTD